MTNDLLIYGENICAFPHILGSCIRSHMNFLIYEEKFVFSFICVVGFGPLKIFAGICKITGDSMDQVLHRCSTIIF
jgi:hypothetical protein